MRFEAIRIKTLSLFNRPVKGPHLVLKSEPSFPKTEDLIQVPDAFELTICQRGGRQMISMTVHLCGSSAEMLLWRSQKDDILNVATNTLVMIVLLEYGGTLMAENPVSLPFSEMTYEKTRCLAIGEL